MLNSSRSSMSSASSVTRVWTFHKTKQKDILLSSGLFDYQCHNLNIFLFNPKTIKAFITTGVQKVRRWCDFFNNIAKMYVTSSKSKSKVSYVYFNNKHRAHTITWNSVSFIICLIYWIFIRKYITWYADHERWTDD